jgi:hypothetical protein
VILDKALQIGERQTGRRHHPTLMVALVDDLESGTLCERTRNPSELLIRARGIADEVGEEVFGPFGEDELRRLVI